LSTVLQAKQRTEFKNSNLTSLRRQGNIPAVVYGTKLESKSVYISNADFTKTMREVGRNGVISLDLDGQTHNVILSDYQVDPVKHEVLHVDLLAVDMSQEINANVRVVLVGESAGVKDGGVAQQPLHELSITAKPGDIPAAIEVDITNLQVGETISIGDIKGQYSVHINHDEEETLVSILPPKQEEEINSGEEQEPGTPDNEEGRETEPSEG